MQAGGVHHHEHGGQAASRCAHDPTGGGVKAHDAGGAAVQAHFFFNTFTVHGAAAAVRVKLRHQKQRQAFGAGRGIGQAGQDEMDDVLAQVVFAARNKNLGAA